MKTKGDSLFSRGRAVRGEAEGGMSPGRPPRPAGRSPGRPAPARLSALGLLPQGLSLGALHRGALHRGALPPKVVIAACQGPDPRRPAALGPAEGGPGNLSALELRRHWQSHRHTTDSPSRALGRAGPVRVPRQGLCVLSFGSRHHLARRFRGPLNPGSC